MTDAERTVLVAAKGYVEAAQQDDLDETVRAFVLLCSAVRELLRAA